MCVCVCVCIYTYTYMQSRSTQRRLLGAPIYLSIYLHIHPHFGAPAEYKASSIWCFVAAAQPPPPAGRIPRRARRSCSAPGSVNDGQIGICLSPVGGSSPDVSRSGPWLAGSSNRWGSLNMSMSELCLATSNVRRPSETECPQTTSVMVSLVGVHPELTP